MSEYFPEGVNLEDLTLEQWQRVTNTWSYDKVYLARILASRTPKQRFTAGGEMFEQRFDDGGQEIEDFSFLSRLCTLPSSVLARVIESLPAYLEVINVIPGQTFKPFSGARALEVNNGLFSVALIRPLKFENDLWAMFMARRVENDVFLMAVLNVDKPELLTKARTLYLEGKIMDEGVELDFTRQDTSMEDKLPFEMINEGGIEIPRLVTTKGALGIARFECNLETLVSDVELMLPKSRRRFGREYYK